MNDAANLQIDRYEIREKLGTGGMARVYRAWDTVLKRYVAIKVLHDHLADDPSFKERFEREAQFIAGFNHPNIVQVHDFNLTDKQGFPLYYMVMSLIPGKTLRDLIEDANRTGKPIARSRILKIMLDLTAALGYAHARGMAHRDVKPGNVLIDENDRAVLTDFGIARLIQSTRLTQDGVSTGTPIYMSPEQASGQAGDGRSDLYSLSIILYEILSGKPPFHDESGLAVMLKHLNEPVPSLSSSINRDEAALDQFLAKALAKAPEDRIQTALEYADELRAAFGEMQGTDKLSDSRTITFSVAGNPSSAPSTSTLPANTGMTNPVLQTLTQTALAHPRTSWSLLILVIVIIVGLFVVVLINQQTVSSLLSQPGLRDQSLTIVPGGIPNIPTNRYFRSSFSENDPTRVNWQIGDFGVIVREFTEDGYLQLSSDARNRATTTIYATEEIYRNVSVAVEGYLTEDSEVASAYGVIFRYQDEDNYNVFAMDGAQRFSIWVRENAIWRELRGSDENWTFDDAIEPLGSENRLSVDIIGDRFTGYINNQRVIVIEDATFEEGGVGIYFATDDGPATAMIDTFQVYQSVPSMTGP